MAIRIRPKDGERHLEQDAALAVKLASTRPWIVSGLALGNGTGLNAEIGAGLAWIDGYVVELDAVEAAACAASQTNHIWLELAIDGNDLVTGLNVVVNTTGTPPSGPYVKLGTATTDGSAVTGTATTGRSPEAQADAAANNWGDIGGTLSDQTDLQSALDAKANASALGALAGLNTVGTSQIEDDAVTFAKTQNIATSRILGRTTAGTGNIEELTAAQVLALLGVAESPKANSKSSNQVINSTSFADVTGLSLTGLSANAVYEITVKLMTERTSGSVFGLTKAVVTGRSGTVYGNSVAFGSGWAETQSQNWAADTQSATFTASNDAGGDPFAVIQVYRFATAGSGGTFKLQAAMSTGSSSATFLAGCSIIATRVS